jgi:hypothetical protein
MEPGLHKTNQAWRVDIFRDHSIEITIHFKIIEQKPFFTAYSIAVSLGGR